MQTLFRTKRLLLHFESRRLGARRTLILAELIEGVYDPPICIIRKDIAELSAKESKNPSTKIRGQINGCAFSSVRKVQAHRISGGPLSVFYALGSSYEIS
jgi:hypothetical protein